MLSLLSMKNAGNLLKCLWRKIIPFFNLDSNVFAVNNFDVGKDLGDNNLHVFAVLDDHILDFAFNNDVCSSALDKSNGMTRLYLFFFEGEGFLLEVFNVMSVHFEGPGGVS